MVPGDGGFGPFLPGMLNRRQKIGPRERAWGFFVCPYCFGGRINIELDAGSCKRNQRRTECRNHWSSRDIIAQTTEAGSKGLKR